MERQWRPVGGLGIAAALLVGLVGLADILETAAELTGQDTKAALLAVVFAFALVTAAPVFIVWLWRARANAELIAGRASQRLGRGWGIGGWLVPIVNLWFPYQYVVDVWRASAPNRESTTEAVVLTWWLALLGTWIVSRFERYDTDHSVALLSCALDVVAAVGLVLVIRRISAWQSVTVARKCD
ncbi:DUF4328 domain-containing protein [Kutzneria sp. CA-103260]|uniref:DUF4328 domain-containing protein n=1 Tax=Kutzneria sp. CA-103260 TaxID=2802641 RepID=UPI001BAE42F6|nr:DUF4328 domain-containing protein [Kutzneria sp. CA-103260]QUQ71901.1 hypothetical protein JJ691_96880 [Kutzneria sp. CA-103260]